MYKLKVTNMGNSAGIELPREVLSKLHVQDGDELFLTETPGGFQISAGDEAFSRQMKAADEVMAENREALRRLAR